MVGLERAVESGWTLDPRTSPSGAGDTPVRSRLDTSGGGSPPRTSVASHNRAAPSTPGATRNPNWGTR